MCPDVSEEYGWIYFLGKVQQQFLWWGVQCECLKLLTFCHLMRFFLPNSQIICSELSPQTKINLSIFSPNIIIIDPFAACSLYAEVEAFCFLHTRCNWGDTDLCSCVYKKFHVSQFDKQIIYASTLSCYLSN